VPAKFRLGASQKPCRDVIELPGVVAACILEQAAWWALILGAAGGALAAFAAVIAWDKHRR
jgi:hypothetical protein